jgi:hypothetical protein
VNWKFFGLEKPDFHNRRIYSAAWIVVGNLPERQYFYSPRRRKDAKLASSSEYHNPCTAWRQHLSPYLKGTVIWQVWSHNWELTRNREMGSREIRILNYEFSFCLFAFCRCGYSSVDLLAKPNRSSRPVRFNRDASTNR